MRVWLSLACALLAGCESCDFGLGPLMMDIAVNPADVVAEITICDKEGKRTLCQTNLYDPALQEEGPQPGTLPSVSDGVLHTYVSWDGLVGCYAPKLEIDVVAEGCEPLHISTDRSPYRETDSLFVEADLACN